MKYIVILGDGMSDRPLMQLNNKTPLQVANKPTIDKLCSMSEVGLVKTLPDGFPLGSDTANLSVMGYEPAIYYSGRSPLEAVSMGIKLSDTDVTYRMNLVNLSDEPVYTDKTMIDYSSDEITTEESSELVKHLIKNINIDGYEFHSGVSYRHCLVVKKNTSYPDLMPPHDITLKPIKNYLPKGIFLEIMEKSYELLKDHPINKYREKNGLKPANSAWFWGEGNKPNLSSFKDKYKVTGAVISAVDLIKGIGICAGLKSIDVKGATGNIHTNWDGKAEAAINALKEYDFIYVHIEAPDEAGHRFEIENKIKAIENIDSKIVKPIIDYLNNEKYRMLILPDHATPLETRTHTGEAVPYILYDSTKKNKGTESYTEDYAKSTGIYIEKGYTLMDKLFGRKTK